MHGHWGNWNPIFLLSENCPVDHPIRSHPHEFSKVPFLSKMEPFFLPREIRKLSPQAFLSPSFSSLWSYPCPHWMICHDLNHLQFGNFFQRQYYRRLLFPALRSAQGIATVSKTAKKELEHWMELEGQARSFQVIPNVMRAFPLGKNPSPHTDYFFCLSNSKPHKNVQWLRLLHQRAHERGASPMISNVGSGGNDSMNNSTGRSLDGWNVLSNLPPDAIGALYAGSKAFFFPSLYEGFGRPPLEAALLGTIPVVSDIPVHRESLQGVKEAIFLPLHDEEAWIKTMIDLSIQPKLSVSPSSRNWILETYSSEKQRESFLRFFSPPSA